MPQKTTRGHPTAPTKKGAKYVWTVYDFDYDLVFAARYCYYIRNYSVMSDKDYDLLEKEVELVHGKLPVGSEREEDYTPAQRALALYLLFSGRFIGKTHSLL